MAPEGDEVTLSADALIIDRGLGPQVVPNPEVGLRLGASKSIDFGGRVNVGGFEANARFRVWESELVELTLVPGAGFGFVPVTNADTGLFNANLLGAVLCGLNVSPRSQLVFGPRTSATYAFPLTAFRGDASGAKMIYHLGGVLGVRVPVGETTYLFPDVNLLFPYDSQTQAWYFPTIQGGVALQLE